jgi:hypothetical protein
MQPGARPIVAILMTKIATLFAPTALALLALSACSSPAPEPSASASTGAAATADGADAVVAPAATEAAPVASATAASGQVLGLEGLGDLRIGQAVPSGSSWAMRGVAEDPACRTVTSPKYPGVYAIVTQGKVRRITVGKRSDVKLAEGIGPGASEAEVNQWFAGFRAEPHKYEDAPAKYLTAPNAASGDPALRFEIGHDGKVNLIHVGTMPVLAYVEGCA